MHIVVILFLMKMALKTSMTRIVFFDTDCISSFLWTKTEFILVHCFHCQMTLPRQVYQELSKVLYLKERVDSMIESGTVTIEDIYVDSSEYNLYFELTDSKTFVDYL